MTMSGETYDLTDPTFLADLRASREAVETVARWLAAQGYAVIVRPTFERPDPSQRFAYSDNGDLEIVQRVEVKHRTIAFTSRDDFPYDSVIVDFCPSYDRALPKPYAYVIANADLTAAFVIDGKTSPQWTRVRKYDRHVNRERDFYECPVALARVVQLRGNGGAGR